jgi:hypothetical protein
MLRGMCDVVRAVTAIRLALAARRDLLLEMLALHHQLAVLARSNRRFRTADRLLWLFLRRMWPQWHDALLLIQPATVDRWHRDRFDRRWWRRSRRPGRPRIDSQVRDLIQRLADENRLWGAPRIHGELLKLGVVVSERTVSRYLHGRPRTPSQTWRTFLANHLGQIAFIDDIVSPDASGDNVVGPLAGAWRSTSSPHWRYVNRYNARWSIGPRRFNAPVSAVISLRITVDTARICGGAPAAARRRMSVRGLSARRQRLLVWLQRTGIAPTVRDHPPARREVTIGRLQVLLCTRSSRHRHATF